MKTYKAKARCEAKTWRSGYEQQCSRFARCGVANEQDVLISACQAHGNKLLDKAIARLAALHGIALK